MPVIYNSKLNELVSASAISECVTPVIICGDDLRVCALSHGARRRIKSLCVGKDVSKFLCEDDLARLTSLVGASLVELIIGTKRTAAIAVAGEICSERYIAFIAEPRASVSRVSPPWYVSEAFGDVTRTLESLMLTDKTGVRHLEWCCATLARLTEFTKTDADELLSCRIGSSGIYRELDLVMRESADVLSQVGVRVQYTKSVRHPFCTSVQPLHVYLVATTLLSALSLISSDGIVTAKCRIEDENDPTLDILISCVPDKTVCIPSSFNELATSVPHLSLELAALLDMASPLGIILECESHAGTLTLKARIPADTSGTVKFHAASIVGVKAVRTRLASLCEYIRYDR